MIKVFGANISDQVSDYVKNHFKDVASIEDINEKIYETFGLTHF